MSSVPKSSEITAQQTACRTGAFTRVFDFVCSLVGLVGLAPLFGLIALAVKVGDGGPVFYSQDRVGRNFRLFRLYKFRTMIAGADRHGLLTAPLDSRLTGVGRLLRRYKLDEFPQLFNV